MGRIHGHEKDVWMGKDVDDSRGTFLAHLVSGIHAERESSMA